MMQFANRFTKGMNGLTFIRLLGSGKVRGLIRLFFIAYYKFGNMKQHDTFLLLQI
jgi:hypothetical protein